MGGVYRVEASPSRPGQEPERMSLTRRQVRLWLRRLRPRPAGAIGRGTVLGTMLGLLLLAVIGPALTFLGFSAYWERAIEGGIILAAVSMDAVGANWRRNADLVAAHRA